MIREYVKEFTTLVLEIPELSDQDSLFYFLDGLQGWAKTELESSDIRVTHNFMADDEAKLLGINATKGSGTIKVVNSPAKAIHGVAERTFGRR
ncbi:hypothetical protein Tco_1310227 [Tanacetum coccineum]